MMNAPLVKVHLWSGLRAFTGGQEVVEVEARTVGDVINGLVAAHPGLEDIVESGVSVAVDGKVIASALNEPVSPENEIWLMQRLKGG
ncbi:MAG: MoaD/ThiS family protein [Paracoccaceae bacterium]